MDGFVHKVLIVFTHLYSCIDGDSDGSIPDLSIVRIKESTL